MRTLIVFMIGLLAGAALFHLYYRMLDAPHRCVWDHPTDHSARNACEASAMFKGYAKDARKQLDALIGDVSK